MSKIRTEPRIGPGSKIRVTASDYGSGYTPTPEPALAPNTWTPAAAGPNGMEKLRCLDTDYSSLGYDVDGGSGTDALYVDAVNGFDTEGTGANQGDGSKLHPYQTVEKARTRLGILTADPTYKYIICREGSYREQLNSGGNVTTANLRVVAYPHEEVWFKGSDIFLNAAFTPVTGSWESNSAIGASLNRLQGGVQSSTAGYDHTMIATSAGYNENAYEPVMVFVDGWKATNVGYTAGATLGTYEFMYNKATNKVYIGANPANYEIEISTRARMCIFTQNVTLYGIGIAHWASHCNPSQSDFAPIRFDGANSGMISCTTGLNHTHGASFRANDWTLFGCLILLNGYTGIHIFPTVENMDDGLVYGNRFAYNNCEFFDIGINLQKPYAANVATDTFTAPHAHGMEEGCTIKFSSVGNVTGINTSNTYYVVNETATTFELSSTDPASLTTLVPLGGSDDDVTCAAWLAGVIGSIKLGGRMSNVSISTNVFHNNYCNGPWFDRVIASTTLKATVATSKMGTATTLTAAITTTTQSSISITSGTGITTGTQIIVGTERMLVISGGNSTTLEVARGIGGTTAATHLNGATVSSWHGYATGHKIRFASKSGPTVPATSTDYWVINETATTFELSSTDPSGTPTPVTFTGSDGTATISDGITAQDTYYRNTGNEIVNNIIFDNDGFGIQDEIQDLMVIVGNLVVGNARDGIKQSSCPSIYVMHNTVYGNARTSAVTGEGGKWWNDGSSSQTTWACVSYWVDSHYGQWVNENPDAETYTPGSFMANIFVDTYPTELLGTPASGSKLYTCKNETAQIALDFGTVAPYSDWNVWFRVTANKPTNLAQTMNGASTATNSYGSLAAFGAAKFREFNSYEVNGGNPDAYFTHVSNGDYSVIAASAFDRTGPPLPASVAAAWGEAANSQHPVGCDTSKLLTSTWAL